MTQTPTITRDEAQDKLDDLRATLTHTPACMAELPRPAGSCDGCEADHLISRVIRDLYDMGTLEDTARTAHHIGRSLSYDLDYQIRAIVAATRD